uniref:Uncharacterized protein n=1 Tax=Mimivirus LCMiAC02 TaxID=2506609 RepID=A0A481Z4B7_9VIRU|nr:MAG: hypothetical protein LCMiAC02_05750 [Mimivirus LCMiAC02]
MKFILIILFITIFLGLAFLSGIEKYSQAAYIQLVAKGPQDAYLSADAVKYIPPIYYTGYGRYSGYYPWHQSTRLNRYSSFPYYNYSYYNYPFDIHVR